VTLRWPKRFASALTGSSLEPRREKLGVNEGRGRGPNDGNEGQAPGELHIDRLPSFSIMPVAAGGFGCAQIFLSI
jgi:hypothetical protein